MSILSYRSVDDTLARAGFTPAEVAAFHEAEVKQYADLTPAEIVLLERYECARYADEGGAA